MKKRLGKKMEKDGSNQKEENNPSRVTHDKNMMELFCISD